MSNELNKFKKADEWFNHLKEQSNSPAHTKAYIISLGINNTVPWDWDRTFPNSSEIDPEIHFQPIRIPKEVVGIIESVASSESERAQIITFLCDEILRSGLIELATSSKTKSAAKNLLKIVEDKLNK